MSSDYTVVDFETSGLDPKHDFIIEVGLCHVVQHKVVKAESWLVNQPTSISPSNAAIHGITTKRVRDEGIPPLESIKKLIDALIFAKALVGHNFHRFDAHFLKAECKRLGYPTYYPWNLYDTAAMFKARKLKLQQRNGETNAAFAARVLAIPVPGLKFSIEHCITELGLRSALAACTNDKLHSAKGDVLATHLIFRRLIGQK